jgi:PAS domain S-box-containing protein
MFPLNAWRRLPEETRGYAIALISVLAAVGVMTLLGEFLSRSIFIVFVAPIALSAWYGGNKPAIAATMFGLIAADLLLFTHKYLVLPSESADLVSMGVYLFVGLVLIHISGLLRAARDEARQYASQLESQALELELQASELEQQTEEAQALGAELEQAHEELKLSTQRQLSEAQSIARLGSWEWDLQDGRLSWSDEMYRLYGLEPASITIDYDFYRTMLHPDDRDISAEIVQNSLAAGEPFSYDHRIIRTDGEVRIFHARGKVISGPDGKAIRMLGTGQDVTESRRAEAALREATEYAARQVAAEAAVQHLNRVFAQAPVMIVVLGGPEHRFELANDRALELLGSRDVIGLRVADVAPMIVERGFGQLLDRVYATNEAYIGNEVFIAINQPGRESGFFNFVFQPLSDESGPYGVLVVATDVSDLVDARKAAEESQREAVAASRAKSDFLARMSHELRTPLAAIIGYGELLADGITGPVTDEQKKQLGRIRSSANHLLAIIDEILTLARMEAGKESVDVRDVDVDELLESVVSMAEPLAERKGLRFENQHQASGLRMQTDPMKLRQVLLNLIANAVKYTDNGTVSLATDASNGVVNFVVNDTGVGVDGQHLEKIFEPFWQVEHTTTRRAGGTGLGLAVTRQFVDLLGGKITVKSELGAGSSFCVSIPRGAE